MKKLCWILILFCYLGAAKLTAQITILSSNVQAYNLVPEALIGAGIMNNGSEQQVQLLTQIFGSSNTVLLTVKSQPFLLKKGLNVGTQADRRVAQSEYGSGNQASYIRSSHSLPSGRYKICITLLPTAGSEKLDDYCDELEAEFSQYLYLVHPLDGDTVESKNPILSWTHSEPFSILNQGEFYRMVVTELRKDQTAEEAVNVNQPLMVKNYVTEHQLQYPFDARELKEGGHYAWQIQKISDGVVVNKTEAWVFNLRNRPDSKSEKYVALRTQTDGAYYTAYDGKVYFKFSEDYRSQGNLNVILSDAKGTQIPVTVAQDKEKQKDKEKAKETAPNPATATSMKRTGDNRYELDLDAQNLNSGFYLLEVRNEKNQAFYLKLFLP